MTPRFLQVRPQGIPRWLGEPPGTPAQSVFWGLLQLPCDPPLVPAELADRFGLGVTDFSRALFELNRGNALQVTEQAHDHAQEFCYDHALLRDDLRQLGGDHPQLLLAGADGLCLAQQGLPEEVCSAQAATCPTGNDPHFPWVLPLHLGPRVVHLCARHPIDTAAAPMLRLVRRLIGLQQLAQAGA